jgi:ParB family chromosome partitioning protein
LIARQALGKGLGALIPEQPSSGLEGKKVFSTCGIEEIKPNPFQPRKAFADAQLQELVESIKEKGSLMEQFHLTQEEISKQVGKDRTTITNAVRLLKLPQDIRQSLIDGSISMGHARAFLSLDGPEKQRLALKKVLAGAFSVRQTENLVKRLGRRSASSFAKKIQEWDSLLEELQRALGTKVRIMARGKRGKIEIEFYSREELDRIIDLLRR